MATVVAGAGAAHSIDALLPSQLLRNLSDRSFEKRKASAVEIEKHIRRLRDAGQTAGLRTILTVLSNDFACNINSNTRKGGLLALSSCAVGLGEEAVLRSFNDGDNRMRYYACEAAFNILRVVRAAGFQFLKELFTGIAKLISDSDSEVKNGAGLLDRLAKEIVCEVGHIDCEMFIPLLRAHMTINNPHVRQCLVGWVTTLDSVPGIDLVDYMPELLEGLFDMLGDANREIRQQAYGALSNFLNQISKVPPSEFETRVAFRPMVHTLIEQTKRERDKFNRLTAVEWLTQFILLGRMRLAPVYDELLAAVLRCLSDPEGEIVAEAIKTNSELLSLVRSTAVTEFSDGFPRILETVTKQINATDKTTRSAALRWAAMLLAVSPDRVMVGVDELLSALLKNLLDTEDSEVLRLNLEVLARLSIYNLDFLQTRVLRDLLQLFADNRALLEAKAAFIIRRLCLMLQPLTIYIPMAVLLRDQPNREFSSLMVELLNLILLTAIEVTELRDILRGCAKTHSDITHCFPHTGMLEEAKDSSSVFQILYKTWCINPIASFSLCLLAQAYELGAKIINKFAETTVNVGVLMQMDKLVQLLETPIFLQTRLHLAQPERPDHQYLLRSLYGLLMMMPQGTAFATLRDRLHSVSALHVAVGMRATTDAADSPSLIGAGFDVEASFVVFTEAQQKQKEALTADLRSRSLLYRYAQQLQQASRSASAEGGVDAVIPALDQPTMGDSSASTAADLSGKVSSLKEMLLGDRSSAPKPAAAPAAGTPANKFEPHDSSDSDEDSPAE